MSKRGPQPQRFNRYVQLKDGSGFTIAGCSYVFKFDRYGGWFDEYGNYYDQDGRPEDPHSENERLNDDDRSLSRSDNEDEYDQYEREFGGGPRNDYDDENEEETTHIKQLSKIAANMEILNFYPCNQSFRVHFRNLHYFSRREDIFHKFSQKVDGIINLVFFNNQRGQFNGNGYFVVANVQAAEGLIKHEGERFQDREIAFELNQIEEFIQTPLLPNQLKCDLVTKGTKHYSQKTQAKKVEPVLIKQPIKDAKQNTLPSSTTQKTSKPEQFKAAPKVNEVKEEPKKVKVEENVTPAKKEENLDDFVTYTFLKKAFPKKTSFKDWLAVNKFDTNDYKTVEKIPDKEDYARITMKRKVYKTLNNATYNGEKIVFVPE